MLTPFWMQWVWLAITLAALYLGGYLLMKFFRFELRQLARRTVPDGIFDEALGQWVENIAHVLRLAVLVIGFILGAFFALRFLGHPAVLSWNPVSIIGWFVDHGVRIIILLAGAYLAIQFVNLLLARMDLFFIRRYDESAAAEIERQKRSETIRAVLQKIVTVFIAVLAFLMLLTEININTTPLLAGFGIIGVGLGFGAQQLVSDLIAGAFQIFENQIRVGDVAVINGTGGLVESMRLRTTILRGLDGTVHVFRNGSISTVSNMTKNFSYYLMDLSVAYSEDTDRICGVVREVVDEMQKDATFGPSILEPVDILGVDEFADSAIVIKLRIKTLPIKQWDVGREFRRRLKYRLDREGIHIPFRQQTVHLAPGAMPFTVAIHPASPAMADAASPQKP